VSHRIDDLDPVPLFKHFAALTRIPRGSGNEGGARDYVRAYARNHGFDCRLDGAGNVVIAVPASPGREGAPIVVLQGHLDMVCEKAPDAAIDFAKDAIPAYVDGDHVRARGTTLGADNGIGVAAALAAGEDRSCVHGPLEILCTIDEETGLTGAFNLSGDMVRGRVMLNLDSEDEGTIFVGCAGGGDTAVTLPVKRGPAPAGWASVEVKAGGLRGGHSGLDIAKGRGNAIRLLARAIRAAVADGGAGGAGGTAFRLACLAGGSKRNAIPRDAVACVCLPADRAGGFVARVDAFAALARAELGANDPDVAITATQAACAQAPIDEDGSGRLIRLLLALPHGPIAMSTDIPGLVETSTNLAVVEAKAAEVTVLCNSRSSVASAMEAVRLQIRAGGELAGADVALTGQYPGWRPDMTSRLLAVARDVWLRTSGREAIVTAIHAGLECGVIGERARGMDMISIGPDIRGAHSPDENVSVPSVGRFYDYLKTLLAELSA